MTTSRAGGFGRFVASAHAAGLLVVQPRMGMALPAQMEAGLLATKRAAATTVGTITVDSYTRVGDHASARRALAEGGTLNGYPIVTHDPSVTRGLIRRVREPWFPIQVRHGSADPRRIFSAITDAELDATEGGPVSYCLPYSRMPLRDSVRHWAEGCEQFASLAGSDRLPHIESFGGCMLGQLCPPAVLVAISALEGMFFRQHGISSVSLSYAQQANADEDQQALRALHRIAREYLHNMEWHVVFYAYMGVYPRTVRGARLILQQAARTAVRSGAARLIVKTTAEAHRIPSVRENVAALETAAAAAEWDGRTRSPGAATDDAIYTDAKTLIDAVLSLCDDIGSALVQAFHDGVLDIPYCLHPDNAGRTRSRLGSDGRLRWSATGGMPIKKTAVNSAPATSDGLLASLGFVADRFDRLAAPHPSGKQQDERENSSHDLDVARGTATRTDTAGYCPES